MDEAITITGECFHASWTTGILYCDDELNFIYRFWNIQLCAHFRQWTYFVCGQFGDMRNCLCVSRFTM